MQPILWRSPYYPNPPQVTAQDNPTINEVNQGTACCKINMVTVFIIDSPGGVKVSEQTFGSSRLHYICVNMKAEDAH